MLLRLEKIDEVLLTATDYFDRFGTDFALPSLCMLSLEYSFSRGYLTDEHVEQTEKLAKLYSQHPLVRISKAYGYYLDRNFAKCVDLLEKAIYGAQSLSSLPPVYGFLPVMSWIERYANKYLAVAYLCSSADDEENFSKAVSVLNDLKPHIRDWEVYFYLAFGLMQLNRHADAEAVLQEAALVFVNDLRSVTIVRGISGFTALLQQDYTRAQKL